MHLINLTCAIAYERLRGLDTTFATARRCQSGGRSGIGADELDRRMSRRMALSSQRKREYTPALDDSVLEADPYMSACCHHCSIAMEPQQQ